MRIGRREITPLPFMRDFAEKIAEELKPVPKPQATGYDLPPKSRLPVNELERQAIAVLKTVTFPVGNPQKKFARDVQSMEELTVGQRDYLWWIIHRYRRQIKHSEVLKKAERVKEL